MRFIFPKSHAFPGGRVLLEDDGQPQPGGLVEFGDGIVVVVDWHRKEDAIDLWVPAYRTSKGTLVVAKTWRLVCRKDGVWTSERGE